uniref:Uncharacterized protein n=1 Tax=Panagrolaimus superbus TaxID=310955 RepID=A0A914YR17_9BILA
MAFWDDFEDESVSLVKKLENESVSLQTIVDDPMCLMLIRDENTKIIDYFSQSATFRQLFYVALNTDIDNTMNDTEQYQFAYQCCEVLCFQQNKLYNAYLDDEEVLEFLTNFLEKQKEKMNHLIASFYARILLSLYNFDHTKVLEALSKTHFLDTALQLLKFSAISELLYNLTTCIPLESRDGVKKYFIEKDFGKKLCNSFKSTNDFIAMENTGQLWAEFIKNMRDFCYNYNRDDELLQHLENPELILELLNFMFPEDKSKRDSSAIVSGCLVLMAVLDRPHDIGQPSIDLNKTEERPKVFIPDTDFGCEALCAKYIAQLLDATLEAAKNHDGDVLARSMIVLEGIFNTSQTKNHIEFVEQLKTANFAQFFDFIKANPTISLLNNSIHTIVSYMLHCALSEEDHLVSYLFNDLGITSIILDALKSIPEDTSNVAVFGARAFFYRLAERIAIAKEQSQNNARITKRISDLADDKAWITFADGALMDYLHEHSPVDLSQTRNHSMSDISSRLDISVDEVVDIGVNELEPTLKTENVRSPTSSMIETLEKLDSNKPDNLFERYRAEMQKDNEEEDLFDLLNRPSTKVATMDVDDWPTSSAEKPNDSVDDELELFKKLKPVTSQPLATDQDWPVTTLPPPLKDQKEDDWNDFNAFSDDFPKKEKDNA